MKLRWGGRVLSGPASPYFVSCGWAAGVDLLSLWQGFVKFARPLLVVKQVNRAACALLK